MSHSDAWFPCYTADLLGSMRWKMMSPAQRGAYWQLICWQMQSDDGHLCADIDALSRLADYDFRNDAGVVLEAFPMNGNGKRANPRALKEWTKRRAISGERSKAGTKGMASRWQAVRQARNKRVTSVTTSTSTSTSTATTREIPPIAPQGGHDVGFDAFWKEYPRKVGKIAAHKAWIKAKAKPDIETILAAIASQKRGEAWTRDGGQYIPNPATWINQGRWDDQPTERQRNLGGVIDD